MINNDTDDYEGPLTRFAWGAVAGCIGSELVPLCVQAWYSAICHGDNPGVLLPAAVVMFAEGLRAAWIRWGKSGTTAKGRQHLWDARWFGLAAFVSYCLVPLARGYLSSSGLSDGEFTVARNSMAAGAELACSVLSTFHAFLAQSWEGTVWLAFGCLLSFTSVMGLILWL